MWRMDAVPSFFTYSLKLIGKMKIQSTDIWKKVKKFDASPTKFLILSCGQNTYRLGSSYIE